MIRLFTVAALLLFVTQAQAQTDMTTDMTTTPTKTVKHHHHAKTAMNGMTNSMAAQDAAATAPHAEGSEERALDAGKEDTRPDPQADMVRKLNMAQ